VNPFPYTSREREKQRLLINNQLCFSLFHKCKYYIFEPYLALSRRSWHLTDSLLSIEQHPALPGGDLKASDKVTVLLSANFFSERTWHLKLPDKVTSRNCNGSALSKSTLLNLELLR
jgi:hypothetical protein